MSKQADRPPPTARPAPAFTPVTVRPRHDGWTSDRQMNFMEALAATACVEEACRAVGMSARAYYTLRARPDAESFRRAADAALDVGIQRLADAMLGRVINGVARPVFYQGEQIGEHRRYDERLGMFLLRTRAPDRYGTWRDQACGEARSPERAGPSHADARSDLAVDLMAEEMGQPPLPSPPPRTAPAEYRAEVYEKRNRQRRAVVKAYRARAERERAEFEAERPPTDPNARAARTARAPSPRSAGRPVRGGRSAHVVNFRAGAPPPPRDDGGGGSG